jgi:uncharacterized caspase-like protein
MDATKEELVNTIKEYRYVMTPYDTFILHVSTHGMLKGDIYYLITSDYNGELNSNVTVSTVELMEFSRILPALNQVFILDTCHAGAADWAFSDLYQKRLNNFTASSGLHLLSASTPYRYALEGYKGHGLFSYFVILALEGQADIDHDGKITLSELGKFVTTGLSRLTRGYQVPVLSNFGKDLVIAQLW